MDRRTIWAILLMMVIAVAPALFLKKPAPRPAAGGAGDTAGLAPRPAASPATGLADSVSAPRPLADSAPSGATAPAGEDTVRVTGPLYTYGFSTRGAKLVQATLHRYASMAPGEQGARAQIMPEGSDLLGLTVVRGGDTVDFRDAVFTPSADSLAVAGDTSLRMAAELNGVRLELTYAFSPDDYRVRISGRASDIGPNGGTLLVGMGPTMANTEANVEENHRDLALVTMRGETERTNFNSLDPGERRALSGPFAWTALKSKYFVTGLIAADTAGGRIAGASMEAAPGSDKPTAARILVSLPVPPSGTFDFVLYAGP